MREKAVWSWQPKDKPKPGLEGGDFQWGGIQVVLSLHYASYQQKGGSCNPLYVFAYHNE